MTFKKGNKYGNRFKPGESGNPAGKPPGAKSRNTILKKWLEAKMKFKDPTTGQMVTGTLEDLVDLGVIKRAMKGSAAAYNAIKDTMYGKQVSQTDITSAGEKIETVGSFMDLLITAASDTVQTNEEDESNEEKDI